VLPRYIRELEVDLLHCPCYTAPLAVTCRLLVSVHDLIAMTHPRLAGWKNSLHLRMLVGRTVRRADAVCVPTEVVRRAVVERFAVPAAKVFVVPWGADADLTPMSREDAARHVRRSFEVDEPFILTCGCLEAKKNLGAAIEACAEAGILLLMAGPSVSGSAAVLSQAARGVAGRWSYLGYVTTADLSALYSAAAALVFPSYVEGFGLPAIEAMRCGCPVVASDDPALREVCGGAAIHVPCRDTRALASAVRSVANDRTLGEHLRGLGLIRAAHFSWEAAGCRFAEALHYAE
jgi:glycosyltransferase involved in cell wall biosynthesis